MAARLDQHLTGYLSLGLYESADYEISGGAGSQGDSDEDEQTIEKLEWQSNSITVQFKREVQPKCRDQTTKSGVQNGKMTESNFWHILTVLHLKWWLTHSDDFHIDVICVIIIEPENAVSFWETSSPDSLPGLLSWTPTGRLTWSPKKSLNYNTMQSIECIPPPRPLIPENC